jgi:septal ring factor EnvC (AmiA/AmiB activator)
MEQAILGEIIKFGGGATILVALYFVLKEIAVIAKSRNGTSAAIESLRKELHNDIRHELDRLWQTVDRLSGEVNQINVRLIKLESKQKNGGQG